jgi:transglutaminase-like putative cysteine protease
LTTFRVVHRTTYVYGSTMTDGYSVVWLTPRATPWQEVRECRVVLEPAASETDSYPDLFGNVVHQFGLHEPHAQMVVSAVSTVDVEERGVPVDATPWEQVATLAASATGELALDIGMFRSSSSLIDLRALHSELSRLTGALFTPGRPIIAAVDALCSEIHDGFDFDSKFSTVSTPLTEVLEQRKGVCQDFAHLAVACLRSLGLAARYVSGYIETRPPPGKPRLVGADASHAWCSVWTPLAGWVDFDPTNGHLPVNRHITVAWGRDYADVTPVRGVMIGPATTQKLTVSVDVQSGS